jgi:hypothetical protein
MQPASLSIEILGAAQIDWDNGNLALHLCYYCNLRECVAAYYGIKCTSLGRAGQRIAGCIDYWIQRVSDFVSEPHRLQKMLHRLWPICTCHWRLVFHHKIKIHSSDPVLKSIEQGWRTVSELPKRIASIHY